MKISKYPIITVAAIILTGLFASCEDFLDREPKSNIAPENYFVDVSQLQAYTDRRYQDILPNSPGNSYGYFSNDKNTDNQIEPTVPSRFVKGEWRVPLNSGNWSFTQIYHLNFFFANVLPKFGEDLSGSQNTISGDLQTIRHYIGEMYFLRAYEYFKRYQAFGDYPIITEPLADDMEILTEAAKRSPRNEVARFILSDLDKAVTLMDGKEMRTTRITRDVALLFKSRVALHEGTWLKYFKGTAFVPNGEGWPGKSKEYNANYQFPSGSIDNEINWFLDQAMLASKDVAERYKNNLTENTGILRQSVDTPENPYFAMFASEDYSSVKEVMLWREYAAGLIHNDVALASTLGNWGVGVTRSYVQNYLMNDGLPVYAHGSYTDGDGYYLGDKTISDLKANKDSRLALFLKEPGQKNIFIFSVSLAPKYAVNPVPDITTGDQGDLYTTGYCLRKGGAWDNKYITQNRGYLSIPILRSAEALLNYMEASYERNGTLDALAKEYWQKLRNRALVSDNIDATIAATDMGKEAENDWAAYSAGQLLSDKTLYNIRRERRCEFLSEGLRWMDLRRWRAMDQLITKPYIAEGFHLWNTPMQDWYNNEGTGESKLIYGNDKSNVSSPEDSEYLRPHRKRTNQLGYDGFIWLMAHYLEPIRIDQLMITAPDSKTVENSPIYQNPYWPMEAGLAAEK